MELQIDHRRLRASFDKGSMRGDLGGLWLSLRYRGLVYQIFRVSSGLLGTKLQDLLLLILVLPEDDVQSLLQAGFHGSLSRARNVMGETQT